MRKFKRFLRASVRAFPFLLLAVAFFTVLLFPKGEKQTESAAPRVVRIWHIDTFEGGRGSRASFLKDAARILEKKDKSVYYLITNYTV